ncbi:esterified fatty acid cis/trans isomerase family protein [Alcanivorax hongdengensis A-11-3]|uniref:Esterified fatty acid cis/trans isomerase family protein n=1 Tax=Alcanivorax hongdengensis A-11-3 TaxID=1177179 RepID=L0WFB8_9GAMM|nr:fatty acid cis/trans isomerase [Alcanivorax hongdengensis]EKF75543.1 esterified fatty acid cis/trans isomerase family protein [Alcanivorax hongdengensis A-11-3]
MQNTARYPWLMAAFALWLLPLLGGCDEQPDSQGKSQVLTYQHDVQPIFEHKCLACHACYDAPCQLKLGSAEGLDRGASKRKVYDGGRTESVPPTRLFVDAQTTSGWRDMGFYSVIDSTEGMQKSLLFRMLQLGRQQQFGNNQKLPDDIKLGLSRQNTCPARDEFDDYADDHPMGGMPLAVTGLTDSEFDTLQTWLKQGAHIDPQSITLSDAEKAQITHWQKLLNTGDKRHQLVGRWLFEHLYLAHLYFDDGSGQRPDHFFKLVRSSTPPGQPVTPLTTVRPNDPPQGKFWYRLTPVRGVIVHKTHITFALSDKKLARVQSLFFDADWDVDSLPGYDYEQRANPFVTFSAIPARARYQFMLDDAEYFVRTFIRGPVCRGQVATDVIRDQFWAVFQDPQHDLYITDSDYRAQVNGLLGLPGQDDDLLALGPQWLKYSGKRNDYLKARKDAYGKAEPQGPGWQSLWDGDGHNTNALLTIFRHHDNASVRRGLIGDLPLTTWVMDYPLFERTYYNLVVNFNVFGSVSHQAQTRLYFDLIRNGAEQNTLRYLPASQRQQVLDGWYQKTGKLKLMVSYEEVDTSIPTAIPFKTTTPMNEFNGDLLSRYADIDARPDPINRCGGEHCARADGSALQKQSDNALSALASRKAGDLKVIDFLPEVTFLRVEGSNDQREIYSLLRDRAHTNVAFMMGESLRYQPELDTLTVYPGILGSYPNFMFKVNASQLDTFVQAMNAVKTEKDFTALVDRYGIRRTHPEFWFYFNDLTTYQLDTTPVEAGLLDMNRYKNL